MNDNGLEYSVYKNDSLQGERKFLAKSYPSSICNTKRFIKQMVGRGVYNQAQCHGFYIEFMQTLKDIIARGEAVSLDDFLKIMPLVKGTFDDHRDVFKSGRNSIDIKATMAKKFVKEVSDRVPLRKKEYPDAAAAIKGIENVRTEANEICQHFSNKLGGKFLKFDNFQFSGIELRNCRDKDEEIFIEKENLNISDYTRSSLCFTILYSLEMPTWLTDGMDIFITLVYKAITEPGSKYHGSDFRTMEYKTRWKKL